MLRVGLLGLLILVAPAVAQEPAALGVPVAPIAPEAVNAAPEYTASAPQLWARGEYVFWMIGTGKAVDMIRQAYQSSSFNALLDATGKTWGDVVKFGLGDDRTGYQLSAGGWLDGSQTLGFEANYLYTHRAPLDLTIGQRDLTPLARILPDETVTLQPLSKVDRQQAKQRLADLIQNSDRIDRPLLVLLLLNKFALPALDSKLHPIVIPFGQRNLADGQVSFQIVGQTFWSAEALGRGRLFDDDGMTVDGLLGYRRLYYEDNLRIHSQVTTLARPLLPGTQLNSYDFVRTENNYDGAFVGVDVGADTGIWSFSFRPSATIAYLNAGVTKDGITTITLPNRQRLGIQAGTYLKSSDLGVFSTSTWTVIPEFALRASRAFGDNLRLTFGTSLVYIPDAARAAPQLELGVDRSRSLPGSKGTFQAPNVTTPDLRAIFLSTFSAGLELRY